MAGAKTAEQCNEAAAKNQRSLAHRLEWPIRMERCVALQRCIGPADGPMSNGSRNVVRENPRHRGRKSA